MSAPQAPRTAEEQLRACREQLAALREEKRRAEVSLLDSEGLFRHVVGASPMGMHFYRLEEDGRLVFTGANPAAERILGVDHRQFVGLGIEEAFPSVVGTEVPERYRRVCATGEPFDTEQIDYEDQRVRGAFEVHAFRTRPREMAALFLDISTRKRTEQALRDSEERYRLLVENAGDGIFIAQDGKVVFANRRAAEMAGHQRAEEVFGRSILDFIDPQDHALVGERHVRRLRGESVPPSYRLRMRRADGASYWTDLNTVVVEWQGRPATLNFIRDIGEQLRLEEQLAAAERLRSIGTLAGGIAHDFNNILMGIQGNVSLVLLGLEPASPLRERLEEVERCVESGAELSARILGFAQGGRFQPAPTDLNALVRGSLEMFARTRKELEVHQVLAAQPAIVDIDRAQIEQVLLNLFVNAWQAMPAGGVLRVATATVALDETTAAAAGVLPGRYLKVEVSDTGSGIDPAIRTRIFEPFFTTKDRGRGTGLGLASAYGIIGHHRGAISVESQPGCGATFTILLPASEAQVEPLTTASEQVEQGAGGGQGTVLLVDDEPMIRSVGQGLLEHLGFTVLVARSGEEALELFAASRGRIDAVVLDMVMPGMSGAETFDRLRALDPRVGVLLSSGYNSDSEAKGILERGCDAFIQKPYRPAELAEKLLGIIQRVRAGAAGSGPA